MASPKKRRGRRHPNKARTDARAHHLWDGLPGRTQHLAVLLVLLLVAVSFHAPLLFSGKALVGGDIVKWRATAESIIDYREATGDEPLWATHLFAGMPAYKISYVNQIPQIDSAARLLRLWFGPVSTLFLMLVGTYLLVFYLTRDKLAGLLSACAFSLTTYLPVILVAGHNSKFVALAFAPWLVLAFAFALRRGTLLSGLLFAVALAANIRAGHEQITYYVGFLCGVWWIVEGVGALRSGRGSAFGRVTLWLGVGTLLSLLMVAHPTLSNFEYKNFSIRGASTGGGEGALAWDYAMAWSQGWGELVTLAIADAYGGGGGTYWGPKTFTGGPHYVGGIVLVLAALALWRVRRRAVWGLGAAAVLMILFSLGEHFEALNRLMFSYFPLFDAFRVPETWLSIVALALAALAGFGACYAARHPDAPAEDDAARTRAAYVAFGGGLVVILVLLVAKDAFFSFERPGETERLVQMLAQQNPGISPDDPRVLEAVRTRVGEFRAERADRFAGDALRTALFLALATLFVALHRQGRIPAWGMQVALALLVALDLGGVGRRYLNEDMLVASSEAEAQIPTYDFDRFLIAQRDSLGGDGYFRVLSLENGFPLVGARSPMVNSRPSYHYESIGGYHGAKLRRYQDVIDHLFLDYETGLPVENTLDLLNVRYLIAPVELPGTEVVYEGEETGLVVLENPDALPRAYFVGEAEVVDDAEAAWARLRSRSFDPAERAVLAAPLPAPITPIDTTSIARADLVEYGPRRIVWDVATDAPRLLVVSEVYYPAGWSATIDGDAAEILPANHFMRALWVPEGQHTVALAFEPRSHHLGIWISGLTTLLVYGGVLVLLIFAWRRHDEPHAEPPPPASTP